MTEGDIVKALQAQLEEMRPQPGEYKQAELAVLLGQENLSQNKMTALLAAMVKKGVMTRRPVGEVFYYRMTP